MHSRETVTQALELARSGANSIEIGRTLDVPSRTVRGWLCGELPHSIHPAADHWCSGHDFSALSAGYAHLLGLYLGDGCLSLGPRGVYRLRITLDRRYPTIIAGARASVASVTAGRVGIVRRADHCVDVYSYWRHWVCHFPQHGLGMKQHRSIVLVDWQRALVNRYPEQLLRGMIESDGCRFENTGRGGWRNPRYGFSNRSTDIHAIFRAACERLGVHWTEAKPYTTYVSRKADVARLDAFIGPKR